MKKYNLMMVLNIKIVGIVFMLMLLITVYDYYLSFQEVKTQNTQYLVVVADFLEAKKEPQLFAELTAAAASSGKSRSDIALALNKILQPMLDEVCVPPPNIKYGLYSTSCENIVAVGPDSDVSLLWEGNSKLYRDVFTGTEAYFIEEDHSILWYGAETVTYVKPIKENDEVVGYAFASLNQDMVDDILFKRTIHTVSAAFTILLFCILVFRELFSKLQKELYLFAEAIVKGENCDYTSSVPEFAPIFNHIKEQTRRMTQLDRLTLISEMAAGIAHEIRNPMTTVRGFLQYLSIKKEFATRKGELLLMIDELDSANRIISEFLSLSKEKAMEFSKTDINVMIQEIYPLLQADAVYKNCNVKMDLCPLAEALLDKGSIHQLLLNIVKNGIDAMSKGGNITLATRQTEDGVYLDISDEGSGIPEEIMDKIGKPFFTTKENGTGLGMAICGRIVHRHGAKMTIESEVDKGTTFTIFFPRHAVVITENDEQQVADLTQGEQKS